MVSSAGNNRNQSLVPQHKEGKADKCLPSSIYCTPPRAAQSIQSFPSMLLPNTLLATLTDLRGDDRHLVRGELEGDGLS